MTLNGIDISSWQAGIDIYAVDADFVIVKATGGVGYVNPDFWRAANDVLNSGKLLGIYHFAGDGNDGTFEEEADHFLEYFMPFAGRAIPILDWEAEATEWPVWWAREWMQRVQDVSGATPWFYSYSSYINSTDCSEIAHFPLWLAAYYAGYEPMGYQDDPPIYGGTGAWDDVTCYQYSSTGQVWGYDGNLDISKFYGDRGTWEVFCGNQPAPEPEPEPVPVRRKDLKKVENVSGYVFRLYNPNNDDHVYTPNTAEKQALIEAGWNNEGVAWVVADDGNVAVYRMYNQETGEHLLTANFDEADALWEAGWEYEGVPFFGKDEGADVYRLYNESTNRHHLTANPDEKDELVQHGWIYEGVAFKVEGR